jgi:unsaturated rhamnogalacturonyl hydrolase
MRLPPKPPTLAGNRLPRRVRRRSLCLQTVIALVLYSALPCYAQTTPWSERVANAIIRLNPVNETEARPVNAWDEETGLQLEGLDAVWYNTANGDYFRYGKGKVDEYLRVNEPTDSDNRTTSVFDNALLGRQLLLLYRVALDAKYYKAAAGIRETIAAACDISSAGRSQSRLKGPCMAQPFLAEYASVFQEPTDFAGITRSFEKWNRSVQAPTKELDQAAVYSDTLKARLAAALVDSLPSYPQEDPGRGELIAMLNRIATEAVQHQDTETGLFDELPRSTTPRHRPDSPTAECLLVYALSKGARLGYLPERDSLHAQRAWQGVLKHFVQQDPSGVITMTQGAIHNARNRSAAEDKGSAPPAALKDPDKEGIGPGVLLLAAAEVDNAPTAAIARGERVMLDAWFNSQQRKNPAGQWEAFHYKWSDLSDSGYSLFGNIFQSFGAMTETLYSAPTQGNLAKARFYIIVSPDIPVKNPNPHYMTDHDAKEIAAWVKSGGVLVLMENDPPNADIAHLNLLADRFGIHFDDVLHHHIIGEQVGDGRIPVAAEGPVFHHPHTLYMKDTCAISLSGPALALLRDRGDVVMATAKYGRGTVFAAVDPWLYNEYTDGRKNPRIYNQFDNYSGGKELVQWLLQQHPH